MRIVFGIMSAVQPARTVGSLVDALGRRHPILIHHDWSQQPGFAVDRPNVSYVKEPRQTGWAEWGFSQGILRLIDAALENHAFDYFQLLSPSCLPVRSVGDFETYLDRCGADFLIDAVRLDTQPHVLMSHGWRAYAPENSLQQRILRRARRCYFGTSAAVARQAGLAFLAGRTQGGPGAALLARMAYALTVQAQKRRGFSHPFSADFPCYVGSTWFTASRRGCEYIADRGRDEALMSGFSRMSMGDEMYFPSVMRNSGLPCAPAVHYIARFVDARPAWLKLEDMEEVAASGAYFARKFAEDPDDPVRIAAQELRAGRRRPVEVSALTPGAADEAWASRDPADAPAVGGR